MSSAPREVRGIREDDGASARGWSSRGMRLFADTEDHELIQSRLGLVYGLMCLVVSGFYVLAACLIAIAVPGRFWELQLSSSKLMHLFGCFAFAGAWLYCRGKPRPPWQLAVVDLGCSLET